MNNGIRWIRELNSEVIRQQWDSVALARDLQLRSGHDASFEHVLKPAIFSLIKDVSTAHVLDAGCGTGALTEDLAKVALSVTGVDFSLVNIEIAKSKSLSRTNIRYIESAIEDIAANTSDRYSLVVANMVLQDVSALSACVDALAGVSLSKATLIATITHPCFWPAYWGYDKEPWFNYAEEQAIEAPFRISNVPESIGVTTHFHRPISMYLNSLQEAGYRIDTVLELWSPIISEKSAATRQKFPRFLAIRCTLD